MKWFKVLGPFAVLCLVVLPLVGASELPEASPEALLEVESCDAQMVVAADVAPGGDSRTPGEPPISELGGQCAPGTPNDCDDYPVPVLGSCECEWEITTYQCQCTNGRRGHYEGLACTICPPPPYGIGDCWSHSSYVCIEGL